MSDILGETASMLVTLLILLGILYLAFRVSKYLGTVAVKQSQSKYIKVIDMMALGQDKAISIAQIGNKYFVLGITSGGINNLAELSEDNIQEFEVEKLETLDITEKFKDIINNIKNKS